MTVYLSVGDRLFLDSIPSGEWFLPECLKHHTVLLKYTLQRCRKLAQIGILDHREIDGRSEYRRNIPNQNPTPPTPRDSQQIDLHCVSVQMNLLGTEDYDPPRA